MATESYTTGRRRPPAAFFVLIYVGAPVGVTLAVTAAGLFVCQRLARRAGR